jgi:ankyrin repeat protein
MAENSKKRQLLHELLDEKHWRMWLANTDLLFILLKKKECKLIIKLVKLLPSFIHRLDEDGNDPLLYVCLKVRGCRHRLVEFFIEMGCDLQRRNSGQNFIDVLQLKRNRKLLENLIEREIIQIDSVAGEMKITFTNRSE